NSNPDNPSSIYPHLNYLDNPYRINKSEYPDNLNRILQITDYGYLMYK
ncbi:11365_t:CDS:1, partial [Ambispora leptoticha]